MARPKLDSAIADAVDDAREAAQRYGASFGVGDHQGCTAEADRVATHWFACTHPGYAGWHWSVTMARASRAKVVTVSEVVLMPGDDSVVAPVWVPWAERLGAGDLAPGSVMPTADNDPRLVPGYTGGEAASDADPVDGAVERAIVAELGLGRERLLSDEGRMRAADRWQDGDGGPHNEMTAQAPAPCVTCGYFIRLEGSLGHAFGACANEYSPSDGQVVSVSHGCGGHSDVVEEERGEELPPPVWDTLSIDESLFD